MTTRIILASSSPRRRELLTQLGLVFEVMSPDVDESERPSEDPAAYVRRVAVLKAAAVFAAPEMLLIAADTTVDLDGRIFAKPDDDEHSREMLRALSGRTHHVHTGLAVRLGERTLVAVCSTAVTFTHLTDATIDWYLSTGEPIGKAGAYAIQDGGGVFVESIDGSVSNVIGLPLHTLVALAAELGVTLLNPRRIGRRTPPAR